MENGDVNQYIDQLDNDLDECEAFVQRLTGKKFMPKSRQQQIIKNDRSFKKDMLMKELSQVLGQLHNSLEVDIKYDSILLRLQDLEEQAKQQDFMDIKRLAVLGIGKRIINLEIYKKEQAFINKQNEKDKLQKEYREHRIAKCDYSIVESQKIKDNIFIVKPYTSGKGFNAKANSFKESHKTALQLAKYYETVREINKIFFNDHKSKKDQDQNSSLESFVCLVGKISIFICISMILLVTTFKINSETYSIISSVEAGFTVLALLVNFILAVVSFKRKPEDKTELQCTLQDIEEYLTTVNNSVKNDPKITCKYYWVCPKDFLWIELHFLDFIPTTPII